MGSSCFKTQSGILSGPALFPIVRPSQIFVNSAQDGGKLYDSDSNSLRLDGMGTLREKKEMSLGTLECTIFNVLVQATFTQLEGKIVF